MITDSVRTMPSAEKMLTGVDIMIYQRYLFKSFYFPAVLSREAVCASYMRRV